MGLKKYCINIPIDKLTKSFTKRPELNYKRETRRENVNLFFIFSTKQHRKYQLY